MIKAVFFDTGGVLLKQDSAIFALHDHRWDGVRGLLLAVGTSI
jgi:FMN phosphatase YigB (HAD superfamily)